MGQESEIRAWLEENSESHNLGDGDLIVIRVEEPSYQWQKALWNRLRKGIREVNKSTGKNVTVLFLTPGWDVEVVPRAKAREALLDLLHRQDEAIETCRSCGDRYSRMDERCPVCKLKVANSSSRKATDETVDS